MPAPIEPRQPDHITQPAPLPGWPVVDPPAVRPYGEVVYVPTAFSDGMVAVPRHLVQPMQPAPPRDLAPQPLIDPRAQVILASGVAAAPAGWGVGEALSGAGQFVSSLAGVGSGAVFWLVLAALLAAKMPGRRAARGGNTYVTNNVRGFGRATNNLR